jgi:transcriptional/translational regulatory protein YebC/TACO1
VAIEAGANEVEPLEEIEEGSSGGRFYTAPSDLDSVSKALKSAGWSVTKSEMGYKPKDIVQLDDAQRAEAAAFFEAIDDHDDCHRIYTGLG